MLKRYIVLFFLIFNSSYLCAKNYKMKSRDISCPTTKGAQFCDLQILNNLIANQLCAQGNAQIAGNLAVDGIITGNVTDAIFGKTLRVDQINGNDATGAANGPPFLTINAALAQSLPGDFIWIFPGIYNESIVIPNGVAVRGVSTGVVTIQKIHVVAATDLITMGENTRLEDVTLQLTSSAHVSLRGIVFPGTSSDNATWNNSILRVDNAGAGAGTSDVYGIHSNGTGQPTDAISAIRDCTVLVNSIGTGKKRGILIDNANAFTIRDSSIFVAGGSDSIGVETNDIDADFAAYNSNISGDTADISQTLGNLEVVGTEFEHSTANGLGFNATILPSSYIWGDPDTPIGSGLTLYLRPGTAEASVVPIFINASQKFLAKALSVRAIIPPGVGESTTWIVQRNGVDTLLSLTLFDNNTNGGREDISIHFDKGDNLSMKMITSAGANTSDVLVTVDVY